MPPKTIQRILAIDLGKFKSVACDYDAATSEHHFTTFPTTPVVMHEAEKGGQKRGQKRGQATLLKSR